MAGKHPQYYGQISEKLICVLKRVCEFAGLVGGGLFFDIGGKWSVGVLESWERSRMRDATRDAERVIRRRTMVKFGRRRVIGGAPITTREGAYAPHFTQKPPYSSLIQRVPASSSLWAGGKGGRVWNSEVRSAELGDLNLAKRPVNSVLFGFLRFPSVFCRGGEGRAKDAGCRIRDAGWPGKVRVVARMSAYFCEGDAECGMANANSAADTNYPAGAGRSQGP